MKDSLDPVAGPCRVVVTSIGSANACAVETLTDSLGLSPDTAAQSLYRAPALVADGLTPTVAERVQDQLRTLGLDTLVMTDATAPTPKPSFERYAVSVYLDDPSHLSEIAEEVAALLGATMAQTRAMLCEPPAVIMDAVTEATVNAVAQRLERAGVTVLASDRATATYVLVTDTLSAWDREALEQDLQRQDRSLEAPGSFTWAEAEPLAKRYGPAGLRVIDTAFLRYDVIMFDWWESPTARRALQTQAGMKAEAIDAAIAALPTTLATGLTAEDARTAVYGYTAAGLSVRTEQIPLHRMRQRLEEGDVDP